MSDLRKELRESWQRAKKLDSPEMVSNLLIAERWAYLSQQAATATVVTVILLSGTIICLIAAGVAAFGWVAAFLSGAVLFLLSGFIMGRVNVNYLKEMKKLIKEGNNLSKERSDESDCQDSSSSV